MTKRITYEYQRQIARPRSHKLPIGNQWVKGYAEPGSATIMTMRECRQAAKRQGAEAFFVREHISELIKAFKKT